MDSAEGNTVLISARSIIGTLLTLKGITLSILETESK